MTRSARYERTTRETSIAVEVVLEGTGDARVSTGIGFFDHMLELLAKHAAIDVTVEAKGDLHVDEHHTVEDVALALGESLSRALGERRGIRRYGFLLPMDESLAHVALDLGGRPYLVFDASFNRDRVGALPTELIEDFFKALSDTLKANIHITLVHGRNDHHKIEAIFKAFGRALRMAVDEDPRLGRDVPSTKGVIG